MSHDVFISYSEIDKKIADNLLLFLESHGIKCWIAPRNISVGMSWVESIVEAIENCKIFIFILSGNSNNSHNVLNELHLASSKRIPIFTFRIDKKPLSKAVTFYISRFQWMDASNTRVEACFLEFTKKVQERLEQLKIAVSNKSQVSIQSLLHNKLHTETTKFKMGPNYGGSLVIRANQLESLCLDPLKTLTPQYQYWLEGLFCFNWKKERGTPVFTKDFAPVEYYSGLLAENWEYTDKLTIKINLRKGIKWQNKPPLNGREFTAYDVQYNYDRILNTRESNQIIQTIKNKFSNIDKVVAVDRYAIEFKIKIPNALVIYQILYNICIAPPEMLSEKDVYDNWRLAIGTGPWILSDFTRGSSMAFSRNPSYWGFDERNPENRLPYIQDLKIIAIQDLSTALAALRTGKIDILTDITWQQAKSVAITNPEIQQAWWPDNGWSIEFRCDRNPFVDIRVRKALQMSVDRKAIAKSYYGGTIKGTPAGLLSSELTGWCKSYEEWSPQIQKEYTYNPTRARELLTEAGYPNGFLTNCVSSSNYDIQLLQIIKAYFMDIGVDMEIKVMDFQTFRSYTSSGKNDQMVFSKTTGMFQIPPSIIIRRASFNNENYTHNNDLQYDMLVNQFNDSKTLGEAKILSIQADIYAIEHHWSLNICPITNPVLWQPYIKGYNGNISPEAFDFARIWIDQDLKKSMGRL